MARVLTEGEIEYVQSNRDPVPHIAGRFAAQEAILKALGTGWRGKVLGMVWSSRSRADAGAESSHF